MARSDIRIAHSRAHSHFTPSDIGGGEGEEGDGGYVRLAQMTHINNFQSYEMSFQLRLRLRNEMKRARANQFMAITYTQCGRREGSSGQWSHTHTHPHTYFFGHIKLVFHNRFSCKFAFQKLPNCTHNHNHNRNHNCKLPVASCNA